MIRFLLFAALAVPSIGLSVLALFVAAVDPTEAWMLGTCAMLMALVALAMIWSGYRGAKKGGTSRAQVVVVAWSMVALGMLVWVGALWLQNSEPVRQWLALAGDGGRVPDVPPEIVRAAIMEGAGWGLVVVGMSFAILSRTLPKRSGAP